MSNKQLAKLVSYDDEERENERDGEKLGWNDARVEYGVTERKEHCHEHDDDRYQLCSEDPEIAALAHERRTSEERVEVGTSGKHVAKALHDDEADEGDGLTGEHEVFQLGYRVALVAVFPVVEGEQDVAELEVRVQVDVQEEEAVGEEGFQAAEERVGLEDERGVDEVVLFGSWWALEQVPFRFLEHHGQRWKHVRQNADDDHLES